MNDNWFTTVFYHCGLHQILAGQREEAACEVISNTLKNTPNLVPGMCMGL